MTKDDNASISKFKYKYNKHKKAFQKYISQKIAPKLKNFMSRVFAFILDIDINPLFVFLATYFIPLTHVTLGQRMLASIGAYYVSKYVFSELYKLNLARKG